MKFSELKGRAVVNLDDATKVGEVEDLLVDPVSRRIVALKVRTGLFSAAQVVPAGAIKNVGVDAVTLSTSGVTADTAADASGTGAQVEVSGVLGTKVVTDAGTLVGELSDVVFDWANLAITGYTVRGGGMFAKSQDFSDTPEVHFGQKMVTIPAQLLSKPG